MADDPRFEHPVAGIPTDQIGAVMRAAIKQVQSVLPPNTGVILFAFDFPSGGVAYIANAHREDCIKLLEAWLRKQRTMMN